MNEEEEVLKRYCEKRQGILLAYVFGSFVRHPDRARDLDVAFLLEAGKAKKSYLQVKTEIQSELSALLGKRKIDVVILNDAPLLLRHEVLKNGRLIFEKNEETKCDFEVESELKFFDFEPVRRLFWESLARRIEEGKLGG